MRVKYSSWVRDCMFPIPLTSLQCTHCAHYACIKPMTIDTVHDGGCRAAVIGMDKGKCGTPSFEESRVCFSPGLTMMPTQSDICWYNTAAMLPGKYRVIAGRWRISLLSAENEADVFASRELGRSAKCLRWENMFTRSEESGGHISSEIIDLKTCLLNRAVVLDW